MMRNCFKLVSVMEHELKEKKSTENFTVKWKNFFFVKQKIVSACGTKLQNNEKTPWRMTKEVKF